MDRYTKYSHFLPLKHPYTAASVAKAIFQNVVKLHGMPSTIVSDRDKVFTSNFWKELFSLLDTKLQMNSAYHPRVMDKLSVLSLEMYLQCATHAQPKKWFSWLALAEFWYNTSHHVSLGCSPFKALYGQEPHYGMLPDLASVSNAEVKDFLADRQHCSGMLRFHLERAQLRMKQYADQKRSDREFQVGDSVFLKLQPYAQTSVANRPCLKVAYKYHGPFPILERIGQVAYRLQLPPSSLIHNVFHVSQLKPFTPDYTAESTDLPVPLELDALEVVPEEILERRLSKKGNAALLQVRVRWSSLPATTTTWEDYEVLRQRFPSAPAWGQAGTQAGGSVTTPVADTAHIAG